MDGGKDGHRRARKITTGMREHMCQFLFFFKVRTKVNAIKARSILLATYGNSATKTCLHGNNGAWPRVRDASLTAPELVPQNTHK